MTDNFDPLNLDNRVSLNRTALSNHLVVRSNRRGRLAHELLSARAFRALIEEDALYLEVRPKPDTSEDPILRLQRSLLSDSIIEQVRAWKVVAEFGYALAALVMTLTVLPEEGDTPMGDHRKHWRTIRTVKIGGGLAEGEPGRYLVETARGEMFRRGFDSVSIELADHPRLIPLIGAARSVAPQVATAAVFDFGGTAVKRGVARYNGGALRSLQVLPSLPSLPLPPEVSPEALATFMTDAIADLLQESGASNVAAAVACYMRDGQPLDYGSGGYQLLRHVSDDASHWLSDAVSQRTGRQVEVALSHDGTTAARVFAGHPHTAVIMLGTWPGVGFAPDDASALRPLARDFTVTPA